MLKKDLPTEDYNRLKESTLLTVIRECLKKRKEDETIIIEMPEKGSFISFIHHNRSMNVPFVIYTDLFFHVNQITVNEFLEEEIKSLFDEKD